MPNVIVLNDQETIIKMIQLPSNLIDMIRKDATDISESKAIKEGNDKRDKLWKSIKVSRAGDSSGLDLSYQTINQTLTRQIDMYGGFDVTRPQFWDLNEFMDMEICNVREDDSVWELDQKTDEKYNLIGNENGDDYFTDSRERDWFEDD
jgi:hypothetical protein